MTAPLPPSSRVWMIQIKAAVAERFRVSVRDLESARRDRGVSHARQVAMHLAMRLTPLTKATIGRLLGGRDHTTVIHGLRSVEVRLRDDPDLGATVRELERRLTAPPTMPAPELQLAMFDGPLFDRLPSARPEARP